MPILTSPHTGNVVALGVVVILNWIIAHLANSWTMPPEVQSALQTLLAVAITAIALKNGIKLNGQSDELPPIAPKAPQATPPAPEAKP